MEESGPSIMFSIRGYLTPTVLFLLLNVVIITIVLTSRNVRRHHQENEPNHHHHHQPTTLERVRSFGLFRFGSRDLATEHSDRIHHHHQDPPPTALERVKSIGLFRFGSRDLPPAESIPEPATEPAGHYDDMDHHFRRIQSESAASHPKLALAGEGGSKLRKLASVLSWRPSEAVTVRRRPAAMREEEVDARADDFINRFKQQLRLQRLNSIMKITRSGSGSGGN